MKKQNITLEYAETLAEEQGGWFCIYCGRELSPERPGYGGRKAHHAEVDHIVPTSKGGTDDLSNLALSCVGCNATKRDRTAHEFVLWRREFTERRRIMKAVFG